jgi:hypothetical protein
LISTSFEPASPKRWIWASSRPAAAEDRAQLVHLGLLLELEGELGAAGEVDADVQLAVDEDRQHAEDHQDQREHHPEAAVLHEVEVGLSEELHGCSFGSRTG